MGIAAHRPKNPLFSLVENAKEMKICSLLSPEITTSRERGPKANCWIGRVLLGHNFGGE